MTTDSNMDEKHQNYINVIKIIKKNINIIVGKTIHCKSYNEMDKNQSIQNNKT